MLAQYFRQVFHDVPAPRRLALVLDLWERVLERRRALGRRDRLLATQSRRDRLGDLRRRRRHDDDQRVLYWLPRRVRRAIGALAVRDDPAIARALAKPSTEPLLCALAAATTCGAPGADLAPVTAPRTVTVPGHPATALDTEDGPWSRALPAARELGADTSVFWDEIAEHGLRVPASWLAHGGWPALWSRAHAGRR
ncbi:Uncharacterised protein [Mycobacterium tuberculosis]|nr:Uncharacterised protein [Mycobacterium tuberculosis]